MREQNDVSVMQQKNKNIACSTNRTRTVEILVISGCIFYARITNIAVGAFLSNFLDFSQFTVHSSENDTENNYDVFFSFYILHLAYTFIVLSGKLVVLLFQS